jgi:hypothetical protein
MAFVAVLFLPYLGFCLMGFPLIEWWKFLLGILPIAATVVLLLEMDRREQYWMRQAARQDDTQVAPQQPVPNTQAMKAQASSDNEPGTHGMSVSELVYKLFVQRKSLVALFVLCTSATVLVTYYIISSLVRVEYQGSGMVVQLPGETVYYIPLYPYSLSQETSWQSTGIELQKGDEFTVEISGMVSPGFLQIAPEMLQWTKKQEEWWKCQARGKERCGEEPGVPPVRWPFTGPQGYLPEWYPDRTGNDKPHAGKKGYEYIVRNYHDDQALTVKGVPHNFVLGLILPESEYPRKSRQYDMEDAQDKKVLVNFSCDGYPRDYKVSETGNLWVVINDADVFRWDNGGSFLLTLTKHAGLLPRRQQHRPCRISSL